MSYGFNKMSNKVLMFDCFKDIEKIRFNHYIMRKENLNRLKKELPSGQFIMTISTVMKDLNLSKSKAERMIREFEKLGIINCVVKGNLARGYSIYEYVTSEGDKFKNMDNDDKKDNDKYDEKDKNTDKTSDLSSYKGLDDIGDDKDNKNDFENSKKENIKKDLNKDHICSVVINYLNKKTGKSFRVSSQKTKGCINARLKEGFGEDDFYSVIDIKVSQWLHNDMQKFLRPETLFSNKFEGYLNEVIKKNDEVDDMSGSWDMEFDF